MSQEQFDFFVKPQIAILETSKNDLFRDLETWTPTGSLAPLEEVDSLGRKVVRLTDNGSFAYLGLTENGNTTLARTVCIEVALDSAANQSFLLRRAAAPSTVSDFIIDLSDGTTTVFATNGATVPVVESSNVTDTTAEYFVTFGPEQFDEWQLYPAVGPSGIVNQGGYDGNLTGFADILALDLNCAPAPTIDGLSLPLGITVGGAVVCDYYTDDGGFQMQHRNSTATIQIFKTTIPGVAWAEIPNLQANLFTLRTIDNGDNTYDHVFSGHLPPNSSIRILGDAPVGAGLGNNGQGQLIIESKSAFGQ
jgi:hypothetical protein